LSMLKEWLSKLLRRGGQQPEADPPRDTDVETAGLTRLCNEMLNRLDVVEKMAKATQRKVYRDLEDEADEAAAAGTTVPAEAESTTPRFPNPYLDPES